VPLYPQLKAALNDVNAIHVRGAAETAKVTIERAGNGWRIVERAASRPIRRARKLLLALSDAKTLEQKSARPENYAALGVDDLKSANASASSSSSRGLKPVSLIVGKQPEGRTTYVREPANHRAGRSTRRSTRAPTRKPGCGRTSST
jgi:hypothetical protein